MRCPQVPQMMMPCSSAGPSRGGPAARSRPCAAALAASRARLASYWSRVMYPGWAPGMKEIHSSRGSDGAGQFPAGKGDVAVPAEGERAGVAGVVQDPQHDVVGQRLPVDLALAGPGPVPPGEGQAGGVERLHAGGGRPGGLEGGEQVREGAADGGVGVEDDVPGGVVDQPDGQRGDQLAAAGLGHDPAAQPGPDEMELSFATSALSSPVI